jgi:putative ABC transport system permease protein
MKYYLFILKSALADFRRNKMRTMLTSLGIMIGVFSVVLLIAIGLGLRKYIQQQFDSLGANTMFIMPGGLTSGQDSGVRFDEKDAARIKRIPGVAQAFPYAELPTNASYGGKEFDAASIISSDVNIFETMGLKISIGRLFNQQDLDKRAKVAVIGNNVAKELYGNSLNAVNKQINFSGQRYKIIGVLKISGTGFGNQSLDNYIVVPYKTAYSFANPDRKFLQLIVKARSEEVASQVKFLIKQEFLKDMEEDDFTILEQTDLLETVNTIFGVINSVLVSIAAISLLVGGIGIMNIMYVTVSERIKEIGIRRALGARRGDILYQFLFESTILSLFGGILGLGLAFVVVLIVQQFFPAYIDGLSVALALGVSSIIGIVFGVFPAKKAADLSPIDAIRYE